MERLCTRSEFIEQLNIFAVEDFLVDEGGGFLRHSVLPPEQLEPFLFVEPFAYTRNLIYNSSHFELMTVVWAPEQASPIHGHEGVSCRARVERGRLRFTNMENYPMPKPSKWKSPTETGS